MKRLSVLLIAGLALCASSQVKAQSFNVSADVVSTYVWRGVKFSGMSVQPTLDFTAGGFSIGSWGSAGFDGFTEMDLYTKYVFDFGLSLGLTDYYYPVAQYFDVSKASGAHALEANLGYALGKFSVSANYIFNEAGGAASKGGDKYVELGYAFDKFNVFVGGGDGWHTPDAKLGLTNVGISTGKEIKFTDSFSLPVKATAILNPATEQFYLVFAAAIK